MSLVEHYVDAVRARLPRQGRDDIAAELRETLLSYIEEAERERRRPLTDGMNGVNVVKILEAAEMSIKHRGREIKL